MRSGDVLEQLIEELLLIAGLNRRATLAVDRHLYSVFDVDCHGHRHIVKPLDEGYVKDRL